MINIIDNIRILIKPGSIPALIPLLIVIKLLLQYFKKTVDNLSGTNTLTEDQADKANNQLWSKHYEC